MVKKVLMILVAIFIVLASLGVYGVYRFFNPFGELVSKEKSDSYFYSRDGEGIIFSPMGNWFSLGKHEMNVDLETFQVLGRDYAKDQEHAYFKSKIIDFGVDVPSFNVKAGYVPMDKNHVYILIDNYYYISDSGKGFEILEDADPNTYEQLNYDFAKDKKFIFRNNKKFNEVDHESFEIVNNQFCKDKNGVYYYEYQQPLHKIEAKVSHVVDLTSYCVRDDEFVYIHVNKIDLDIKDAIVRIPFQDADQIYFYNDNSIVRIDDKIYFKGEILEEANVSTFEEIGYGYVKDDNFVFFQGQIVEGADPHTFKYNDKNYTFTDKNHTYEAGVAVKK
ncbi:DKNYY domain-containing protein [Aquimarina sediminis]|uniref:DKNYY domain-containing protein n=1 Tax=Aquimarina sediminis TaxID=2070536 RepID=UPI000CA02C9F|nr:DKNYY domain-containing protein [Aquimarina sediminis]